MGLVGLVGLVGLIGLIGHQCTAHVCLPVLIVVARRVAYQRLVELNERAVCALHVDTANAADC